jgi:hypothetical protein
MTALLHFGGTVFRLVRWPAAALALIFGVSGCAGWNYRNEGFKEDDLSATARQARAEENANSHRANSYWSDEKGQQIERDLNVK